MFILVRIKDNNCYDLIELKASTMNVAAYEALNEFNLTKNSEDMILEVSEYIFIKDFCKKQDEEVERSKYFYRLLKKIPKDFVPLPFKNWIYKEK